MASCVLHMVLFPDPVKTLLYPGSPSQHQHHSRGRTWARGGAILLFCFFFFLLKELWVDHVQLQLTKKKKKKNTKYLLERRGGTNGALSGHYISCQSSPFPPNCLLVTIDVSALYLNIPQDEGPSECLRSLENRDLLRLPRNIMQTLFDIVLKCNTT